MVWMSITCSGNVVRRGSSKRERGIVRLRWNRKARVSLPRTLARGLSSGGEVFAPAPPPKAQASEAASRSLDAVASLFRKACQARKPPTRSEAAVYPNSRSTAAARLDA